MMLTWEVKREWRTRPYLYTFVKLGGEREVGFYRITMRLE
jgi:hypothetical protein